VIRILIADDHAILRRGLKEILAREFKSVECGEAGNTQQVLSEVEGHNWDLLILDVMMPGRSGLDILKDLEGLRPKLPVLVLSTYPESLLGKRVLKAGASGYMNKECAPEDLVKAVRRMLAGGRYVSPALAELLALDLDLRADEPLHARLSDRELEVLRLIGTGKTNSQIADLLHLAVTTVSTYRAHILEKMHMTTTAELMNYAIRNGIVD